MLSRPEYFPWYHISLFMNSSGRQALCRTAFNQDNKRKFAYRSMLPPYPSDYSPFSSNSNIFQTLQAILIKRTKRNNRGIPYHPTTNTNEKSLIPLCIPQQSQIANTNTFRLPGR
jgi:hypothetical protein